MVRVSRPLPFLLLASAALVVADPHPHSSTNALSSAHTLHERTLLGGILGALFGNGHRTRCPLTFKCDGSGTDGYQYDYNDNSCPSHLPSGWHYFGASIGWAPPKAWSCSSSWNVPSVAVSGCSKATWWTPGKKWKGRRDFTLPRWWNIYVDKSWSCDKTGLDGQIYDYNGNTLPSAYPSGWLWFGSNLGWAPPKGWACASSWVPSASASASLSVATWWAPPSTWIVPSSLTISIPNWWAGLGWVNSAWPSKSWKCSGKGTDGLSFDWQGNTRPSAYPEGWLYFGADLGWAPPKGWACASSWVPSSSASASLSVATWWAPPSTWIVPSSLTISIPNWWAGLGWVNSAWPSKSWKCSGKGTDGLSFDWQGNTLPTGYPAGWLWFGIDVGFAPPRGWIIPSAGSSWVPSAWIPKASACTWWSPPASWTPPASITAVPTFWSCSPRSTIGASTTTSSRPASTSAASCSGQWAQCGGISFVGASCCPSGFACSYVNQYYSQCQPVADITTTKAGTTSRAVTTSKAATTSKVIVTTTKKASTTMKATTSVKATTTQKASSSSKKPVATSTKAASTTKKVTTSVKASSTSKGSTTSKATSVKATATTKATATKTGIPGKVTVIKPVTQTIIVEHTQGGSVITIRETQTVTQIVSAPAATVTQANGWPSSDWQCDGSGDDGFEVDYRGNKCGAQYPSGWKWFGSAIGWAPPRHFIPATNWVPSSSASSSLTVAIWWCPPSTWIVPSGFTVIPSFWYTLGWSNSAWPSRSWECNGTGRDGWTVDWQGNSRPHGFGPEFLWFGVGRGWQVKYGFVNSARWSPPSAWVSKHATWWSPSRTWHYSGRCQKWWRTSLIRGSWKWAL